MSERPNKPEGHKICTKPSEMLPLQSKSTDVELPNIWIDPHDKKAIREYVSFWLFYPTILRDQVLKLDKRKRQEYLWMMIECAKSCPKQQYLFENSMLNWLYRVIVNQIQILVKEEQDFYNKLSVQNQRQQQIKAKKINKQPKPYQGLNSLEKPPKYSLETNKNQTGFKNVLKKCFSAVFSINLDQNDKKKKSKNEITKYRQQEEYRLLRR